MKQRQSHFLAAFDEAQRVKKNHLYYGDNLTIMRNMPNMCVDLIYLDPPFNSQRNYNLIYKKLTGQPIPEQEEAFCDAWEMDAEKLDLVRNMKIAFEEYGADPNLLNFWETWIKALRYTRPHLLAYLIYMTYRLFEMRRILKPTGSLYLHCDPTASHYVKVIMDGIFGHLNFRNEIIWRRTGSHNQTKSYGSIHDTILFYTKSGNYTFNVLKRPYMRGHVKSRYAIDKTGKAKFTSGGNILTGAGASGGESGAVWRGFDPSAKNRHWAIPKYLAEQMPDDFHKLSVLQRLEALYGAGLVEIKPGSAWPTPVRYLKDTDGQPIQDLWAAQPYTQDTVYGTHEIIDADVAWFGTTDPERLGYPTQKPIGLLERIIKASSNEGDVVFDPFAGCGTTIYAAHLTGRKWIGCDIAILSVKLTRDVLETRYGLKEGEHYEIDGIPVSVEGAKDLFDRDPHQFQHWAVELASGFASTKRTGDLGIDGRIYYETGSGLKNMVISVKGGKLTPAYVRELRGVIEREPDVEMGGFICLQKPTKGMISEAAQAGTYNYLGEKYERLQIRTIEDLLNDKPFDTPSKVKTLNWIKQLAMPL